MALIFYRDPHGRPNAWNEYVQETNLILAFLVIACMMIVHISNNLYLTGGLYGHSF